MLRLAREENDNELEMVSTVFYYMIWSFKHSTDLCSIHRADQLLGFICHSNCSCRKAWGLWLIWEEVQRRKNSMLYFLETMIPALASLRFILHNILLHFTMFVRILSELSYLEVLYWSINAPFMQPWKGYQWLIPCDDGFRFRQGLVALRAWTGLQWSWTCIDHGLSDGDIQSLW